MSMNHFSSSELPQPHWQSHSPANTSSSPACFCLATSSAAAAPMFCNQNAAAFTFDLNNDDEEELVDEHAADTPRGSELQEQEIPKERLFEKPLTPSDVGKLNRLVIPKQHAEKHFPLHGGGDSGENGLLLGFEDEVGKSWRFRYSYWNSSQSYVLTKGWSRFVKEKRLDSGDVVVFARHRMDAARLFIGWRRRNSCGYSQPAANGGVGWSRVMYCCHTYQIQQQQASNSLSYQPESLHAGAVVKNQTTSSSGSGNSRRLRLFGVNLECQADDSEPWTPVGSPMSSHHHLRPYHQQQQYYSSNHHMDIGFSGAAADEYRQG